VSLPQDQEPDLPAFHAAPAVHPTRTARGRYVTALRATMPLCAMLIAGCTWYHREPLAPRDMSTSASTFERIQIDLATMPLPELAAHRFDPSAGLVIEEVAMLAVANNPDLKLTRDDLGIAHAQLSVSSDYPGAEGMTRAFNYGLSMDLIAIVTRGANKKSADRGHPRAIASRLRTGPGIGDAATARHRDHFRPTVQLPLVLLLLPVLLQLLMKQRTADQGKHAG
jgi:hypothetical protein